MKDKILIVDDSLTNTILLANVLEKEGYKTESALGVKEARDIMARKIPDLILLDLHLPESSGYDFMKKICKNEQLKSIPVIIVSADEHELASGRPYEMGAVGCINKPIDLEYLVEVVKKQLKPSHYVSS